MATAERKTKRQTSRSAGGDKPRTRIRQPKKSEPKYKVRPALLYALALACVIAVGSFSIRAIHASAPEVAGFDLDKKESDQSQEPSGKPQRIPASVDLMKTQGWIAPASVEIYERERRQSALPPEIAAVPETLIDTQVIRPDGGGYLPPPQDMRNSVIAGGMPVNGSEFGLPQLREGEGIPSSDAIIIQGNQNMPRQGLAPETTDDKIGSMIAGIDRAGQPTQPATENNRQQAVPPQQSAPPKQFSLEQLQTSECSRLGFFARIACNDRVRQSFCEGKWNQVRDCSRFREAN
ncbi:MAG: hypothetical protein WBD51_10140 [Burkholderiaceae bacterium]